MTKGTRYIKASEVRWLLVSLIVLVLLAAAINVPFAITRIRSRTGMFPRMMQNLTNAEAAEQGWPSGTPHERAWPAPNYYTSWTSFGYREYSVKAPGSTEEGDRYSMLVQHLGWPLPVIEIKMMWWDWDDPALKGPEPDPRPGLMPLGVLVNPLLVGVPVWFIVCALPVVFAVGRRRVRARRGRCAWCGYEIEQQHVCPECGVDPASSLG